MDWENRTVWLLLCSSVLLATIHDGNAERKIVCYYTNWSIYRPGTAKFSPQNINPYLCTHLIYAFGGFTKDNALKPFDKYQDIEKGGYAKFTGLKTYNKNLKTLLAIGGWNEGSSRFSPMVADPDRRREFVKNAIKFLRKNHFDGLDLDWEYPAFRDGGKPRDKDNYASLVQELREEFERESSKTGRPRLLLTLAMPAGVEYIDKGYDILRLNEYLDFINLLSYDYHSSYEPAVNHHSPLYPLEEDNEYNYDRELTIDYTIDYLLKKGASPEKVVLGIPTYGRSYTLFNQDATDLGSPADGPGVEGDATREKGYLAYYEICESLARSDEWEVIQPNPKAMGPYAFKGDQWVGYDDEDMVRLKARYANEKNLGGIMFWTIDNDDFRGKCHGRPYPLIEAAKEALLTDDTNTVGKPKTVPNRKKPRVDGVLRSNTIGRKLGSNARRSTTTTTTTTATPKKRISPSRPKYRTFSRAGAPSDDGNEDENEEEEQDEREAEEGSEVSRRSYDPYSDEEELAERGNAVRAADKNERSGDKGRGRQKSRSNSNRNRRRKQHRKGNESRRGSSSDKLTTPEPPTTPDPGTDFKCEDEGFFPHPRDCKKYFWCLDSGPGGLGVVAHQFTCPSGLVFNKAADSCDYPRNVVCPKSKTSQATASTTRASVTAATSRTTYLYSTTRRPSSSTKEPDTVEEYEYYDDDDDVAKEEILEEKEDEEDEEEEKKERKSFSSTTTPKTLLYKTIARNKPTSTAAPSTTSKSTESNAPEKTLDFEDEEDPRVIKELIMLIKKAGGIEQLEKQLLFQDRNLNSAGNSGNENATPATISRTLYERVLNRQAGKTASREGLPGDSNYANGPGRAQFEGLDQVPEVKSLRRSQKPQYVTIERPKPLTREQTIDEKMDDGEEEEEEEEEEEQDLNDRNENEASSEEERVDNPPVTGTPQRVTPNYINIRRARPSISRNENDVEEKAKNRERGTSVRRRRPGTSSKNTENSPPEHAGDEMESRPDIGEENLPTMKSRYVSALRFRSTTPQPAERVSTVASSTREATTESTESSEAPKIDRKVEETATAFTVNPLSPIVSSSTPNDIPVEMPKTEKPISTATTEETPSSTTESVKLVEDSATEILLTTAPASLFSTIPATNTRIDTASVLQPRPFGFNRRNRPASEITTTPLPAFNDQTRSKVADSEVNRLPTLKELIGYRTNDYSTSSTPIFLSLLPSRPRDENDYTREKERNRVLETVNIAKATPWTERIPANEIRYSLQDRLDLAGDKIDAYYAENNIAADESDTPSSYKKRFDREDSSTTTLRPTTLRGIRLVDLLQTQTPRGFYVTVSEAALRTSNEIQNDTSNARISSSSVEDNRQAETADTSITDLEQDDAEQHRKYSNEPIATTFRSDSIVDDDKDKDDNTKLSLVASLNESVTVPTSMPILLPIGSQHTGRAIKDVDPVPTYTTELPTRSSKANSTEFVRETESYARDETNATESEGVYSLDTTDENGKLSTSTTSSRTDTEYIGASVIRPETMENDVDGLHRNVEFGRKFQSREQTRRYVRPSNEDQTESARDVRNMRYPRRRVITDTRRYREPRPFEQLGKADTDKSVMRKPEKTGTTTGLVKEFRINSFGENQNNEEGLIEEGTDARNMLMPKASQTSNDAVLVEESLRIDGFKTEVNSSMNTVTLRASGNLAPTRLRKPTAFASTSSQSKSSDKVTSHRKTRPTNGNATLVNEKVDATDQSSRAQEIAVTLADPPSLQPPVTGRPSFRNGLRRKISTTVAPRTDTTTNRTTLRLASIQRDRQGPKVKDKPLRNVASRTRRPPVIDYDYYEDEEEPVVGKSTYNEKLFLTSAGTFRCLDQGNFPHPYSCKKFITCAKMVNGLVIGAEYSCPNKLSFDPVGGICNWSAGLGCKD